MAIKFKKVYFHPNEDGALSERTIKVGPFEYSSVSFEDGSKDRDIYFSKYLLNICTDGIMFYINGKNRITIDFHN